MAAIEALVEQDIGALNKQQISEWVIEADKDKAKVENEVPLFQVKQCYDENFCKLRMVIHNYDLNETVILALKQLGGKHKVGKPPPNHLERNLGEWLEDMRL